MVTKCPKCGYPQYCDCWGCRDKIPTGYNSQIVTDEGYTCSIKRESFTKEELSTILAEEEKDTGWLMYVVVAVVAIGILFFTMG